MSEFFSHLWLGFSVAALPINIAFCFLGALLGTLIGVLPGIGPTATIAILLPITFGLPPETAIIMLAGIYYGANYGGSTTAILVNLPGEAASVVTAIDGHRMAQQGRAGTALAVAAIGSFFAGTVGTILVAALSPILTQVALSFGPAEYFSLIVLGLLMSVILAHGSVLKSLAMVVLGLALGLVGTDIHTGALRLTFGVVDLFDGIDFVTVAMGLFGIGEIIRNLEARKGRDTAIAKVGSLMPNRADVRASVAPVLRGTALGSFLGILPGAGPILAAFGSYVVEKRTAHDPSRFGNGAIEGVAGPEAANNAAAQTSFIPLLTLGIPTNSLMALLIGALIVQGIQPGPLVIIQQPELFWGLIASMWIGNVMLLVINLPLIGLWVKLLSVPYHYLYPVIVLFCAIGAYSLNNNTVDILLMAVFGLVGYGFLKLQCEPAPLILGFVLGPLLEENLRRALTLSFGDPLVFLQRPISAGLLIFSFALLTFLALPSMRKQREETFQDEEE